VHDTTITVQGVAVPRIGLGTWLVTGEEAHDAVLDALQLGYRHIDTARAYENEVEVGRAIAESGVPRSEIWVTTKVWYANADAKGVWRSCEASLKDLGLDHVDLLLLHWPNDDVPLAETMGALGEVQQDGGARHVGVSNFPSDLLAAALDYAPLFANQVEYHPYLEQSELLRLAREHDLLFEAYSPFAHGRLLDDPVLHEIAAAHDRTAGQVALRWLLDQPQVVALPKAGSHERRAENLEVFDFELHDDERDRIAALERGLRTADPPWAPVWD
jgi:2,5-diketo-D-gluconate reductase B